MLKNKLLYCIGAFIPVLLVPVLGYTWLIFSVYLVVLAHREKFESAGGMFCSKFCPRGKVGLCVFLIFLFSGLLLEILAIVDNLPKPPDKRILLHPDPLVDFYLAIGYYSGFGIVWTYILTFSNILKRQSLLLEDFLAYCLSRPVGFFSLYRYFPGPMCFWFMDLFRQCLRLLRPDV